jgi:hypothetical protein
MPTERTIHAVNRGDAIVTADADLACVSPRAGLG